MTAKILDGRLLSLQLQAKIKKQVSQLKTKPGLAVILVGDDPASKVYIGHKEKACLKAGFHSEKIILPATVSKKELFLVLKRLNKDKRIHGILVQLPLPKRLQSLEKEILAFIKPEKDVDGFHPFNAGQLFSAKGQLAADLLFPATPRGIMHLIKHYKIKTEGKEAVVVGRSNLVGKPIAILLLAENATVTVCHSRTQNLKQHTQRADILVVAVGRPKMVTADYVKKGSVVIDVGINRLNDGLVGDIDFDSVKKVAKMVTPVPGGVGPMTIACLLENTLIAYQKQLS